MNMGYPLRKRRLAAKRGSLLIKTICYIGVSEKSGENSVHYAMFAAKCKADITLLSGISDEFTVMTAPPRPLPWRSFVGGVLALLFPPRCHACRIARPHQPGQQLCLHCLDQVAPYSGPHCLCCGRSLAAGPVLTKRLCGDCLRTPPPFDSARSLLCYGPPASTLLHRLKFHGDTAAARVLTGLASTETVSCELIIPVPLHRSRLRSRGLNQSLVLARRFFAAERDKIVVDLLVRLKKTIPQTGLDGIQRRRNLKGAFAVARPEEVRGRTVLVVDDVFTTGTTLAECSRTLKAAGAAQVHVWTVARVDEAGRSMVPDDVPIGKSAGKRKEKNSDDIGAT
jgi:ComF family protein